MKKKVLVAVMAVAAAISLVGCGSSEASSTRVGDQEARPFKVDLLDGRFVECIWLERNSNRNHATGGPACWPVAK
ncbi:hypothetical protein CJ179_38670 [Rhodococcus sp. ACS1]|uniref:hypothetical protein n=1 Tax=Rhodococcus sp. ACS1 TaxID=2028570 RepID=UPI000BB1161B|nr:hypothetical protein [Rhodococcus sp. ACS1]PBC38525.1 hypothetical protein CJ179_38670 [Rhodococcus sp. ACS1]